MMSRQRQCLEPQCAAAEPKTESPASFVRHKLSFCTLKESKDMGDIWDPNYRLDDLVPFWQWQCHSYRIFTTWKCSLLRPGRLLLYLPCTLELMNIGNMGKAVVLGSPFMRKYGEHILTLNTYYDTFAFLNDVPSRRCKKDQPLQKVMEKTGSIAK